MGARGSPRTLGSAPTSITFSKFPDPSAMPMPSIEAPDDTTMNAAAEVLPWKRASVVGTVPVASDPDPNGDGSTVALWATVPPVACDAISMVTSKSKMLTGFVAVIPVIVMTVPGSAETSVTSAAFPRTPKVGDPVHPAPPVGGVMSA